MEKPIKNSSFYVRLPFLLAITLIGGILIGANMFGGGKKMQEIKEGYTKFRDVLMHINESYVDTVNTEQLVDFAIDKMLEKLDPHTSYIPAKDVQIAHSQLEGDFEGVGIEFNIFKDTLFVVSALSGGPSEKAGLRAGDKIIKVNGKNVAGKKAKLDNAKVFKLLRGKKGSKVKLSVKRKGIKNILTYTITRDKIPNKSIDVSYMIDSETGFIKITRFASGTYSEFKSALRKLKSKGMKRMILDLRDNPGGYMDRAINIADEMISGSPKIVYTDGKGKRFDSEAKAKINGMFEKGAVIVLIDEGSASASEIVAGALQDNDRALIVGRRSFGKGLVQMPIDLDDGSELRLTISRYYTPSGRSIQKPYEDYEDEYKHRLESGELFYKDSIKVNKKLKYKTAKGRTVYGGGGIVPDVFVATDTSSYYQYLNSLYPYIREFALEYYNDNQKTLEKQGFDGFNKGFQISEEMLDKVVKMGERSNIKKNAKAIAAIKDLFKARLKAFIARSVWGDKGFYPIIHESDEVFQKAIKLFDKAEKLEKGVFD